MTISLIYPGEVNRSYSITTFVSYSMTLVLRSSRKLIKEACLLICQQKQRWAVEKTMGSRR